MLSQVWEQCHASVCSLHFINERGMVIDSLSGFKVNSSLITSEYAFYINNAQKVEISFVEGDANTPTATMRIGYNEFINDLRIGYTNNQSDYAVFNINFSEFEKIPGLTLCECRNFQIGKQVATLGFNFGENNLSIKSAVISSAFSSKNGIRCLELDGLTCFGNSGSPVIDPDSMQVIAIISRRSTPAFKSYMELNRCIVSNIEELRKLEGKLKIDTIDPVQVLIANQNQIRLLASNLYKYTATGSSKAIMLDRILSYFNEQAITEQAQISSLEQKVGYGLID
ncbi:MAG: trypsin-like peptidase domain-containing protein [Bacteroidales bacterium]|nr:trypsin-like peptidase domain-containing protein [Bacteroidales bacterium]